MKYILLGFVIFFIGCTNSSNLKPTTDSSLCNATVIEQPSSKELEKFNQKCEVPKWSK